MAACRLDSTPRRQPSICRHPQLRALSAVRRLRLICGVHRVIPGHNVTDLLLVLFDGAIRSGFDESTRCLATRHWLPMA